MRTVTFSDERVKRELGGLVLYWENQVPGVYAPAQPEASFPREMTEACLEGSGGNNLRHFLCDSGGIVRAYFTGYWKAERFLAEMGPHDPSHAGDPVSTPLERAQRNRMKRSHEEAAGYVGRPIADVLREVRDEVYTKGNVG